MAKNLQSDNRSGNAQPALDASGLRFAIVVSRFNSAITDRLLAGAIDALQRSGAAKGSIETLYVPGAFELPLAAKKLALRGGTDAIIALGCVIRGETSHYDYVCSETARGLQLAQMDTGVPVIFGVLTCDTAEQAMARAGGMRGNSGGERANKGYDCGLAAIEMARLSRQLREKSGEKSTKKDSEAPARKLRRA
jgi:6,7-dimethyl-8-ribityllumazine synthase